MISVGCVIPNRHFLKADIITFQFNSKSKGPFTNYAIKSHSSNQQLTPQVTKFVDSPIIKFGYCQPINFHVNQFLGFSRISPNSRKLMDAKF